VACVVVSCMRPWVGPVGPRVRYRFATTDLAAASRLLVASTDLAAATFCPSLAVM
jgi:hypothetical protein